MRQVLRWLFRVSAFRIGLGTGLLFAALHLWVLVHPRDVPALGRLEGALADTRFSSRPRSNRVVIAAVDEAAIAKYGRFPWNRRVIAKLVDKLDAQGAAAIGFDITFSDNDRVAELAGADRLRTRFEGLSLAGPAGKATVQLVAQADASLSAAGAALADLQRDLRAGAEARYRAARDHLADGAEQVSAAKPRLEALERGHRAYSAELEDGLSGLDSDLALADSIRKAGAKVVLGYIANTEAELRGLDETKIEEGLRHLERSRLSSPKYLYAVQPGLERLDPVQGSWLREFSGVSAPLPAIASAARSFGFINASPDDDGVIRKDMLAMQVRGRVLPSLDAMLMATALGVAPDQIVPITSDDGRSTGRAHLSEFALGSKLIVPTDARGLLQINYSGGHAAFPHLSVADILEDRTAPAALSGKIVLVGVTAQGTFDQRVTPLEKDAPGVEIHANAVETMLSKSFLRRGASVRVVELSSLVALALLFAWIFSRVRVGLALPALCVTAAALWAANLALFQAGYDVVAALPLVEIGSIFVLVTTYRYATEERDRRALRKAFQLYLNPDVMDEMLRQPEKLQLGGEERELTVLFSDIRRFTAISEKLSPKALVHLLNDYLSPMTDIVFAKRGTLDKYIGDAVMAFFGAPIENPRHALHCCEVALEMVDELARLRRKWRADDPEVEIPDLEIGIGVNSGKMVVGNMGSSQRFNYTVMGDNVNVASRLEGLNKLYGTNILISEATLLAARAWTSDFCVRELDSVRVVGRAEPLRIFELRGKGPVPTEDLPLLAGYARALQLYRERRFGDARLEFESLTRRFPHDGPSRLFLSRCEQMAVDPPESGWDGSFRMEGK
jgi:adenylate cyclase